MQADLRTFLEEAGLVSSGGEFSAEPLMGGVSSDIWKIEAGRQVFCVKTALAKLRTKQDWYAPVSRNGTEVDWFLTAADIIPQAVPKILAFDKEAGVFAMDFLPPEKHPVWKDKLSSEQVDVDFAQQVGGLLSKIHVGTANRVDINKKFNTQAQFHDLRLSPYLWQLATEHPSLQVAIERIVHMIENNNKALIHGDVSPKNILSGPDGPVFLDAETACYGDPAFDLGFCLNHLLLKMIWVPQVKAELLESFHALKNRYVENVTWENPKALDQRTAQLLPALLLARVDGKSPLEYITDSETKNRIRQLTKPVIEAGGADSLDEVARIWTEAF